MNRRRHDEKGFLFTLLAKMVAGDESAEWPEYQPPEEGPDPEAAYEDMERELVSSSWVSHMTVEQQREMEAKNKAAMEERLAEMAEAEASI